MSENKNDGLRDLSKEALCELWERADRSGGYAGGWPAGLISNELARRYNLENGIQPDTHPMHPMQESLRRNPRPFRLVEPSDYSLGMAPITRQGFHRAWTKN